jgi:hypothetical protein
MKFQAAIAGVDLDEESKEPEDVASLQNTYMASKEGFGAGEGLGFMTME